MNAVILIDPVAGRKGVYEVPEALFISPDEPMSYLEKLKNPKKERGKVLVDGQERMMTVHVVTIAGILFPYVLASDLENIP